MSHSSVNVCLFSSLFTFSICSICARPSTFSRFNQYDITLRPVWHLKIFKYILNWNESNEKNMTEYVCVCVRHWDRELESESRERKMKTVKVWFHLGGFPFLICENSSISHRIYKNERTHTQVVASVTNSFATKSYTVYVGGFSGACTHTQSISFYGHVLIRHP